MNTEIMLDENSFLVSETDSKGLITFANDDFCKIAAFTQEELVGQPHNIVRHNDMPKVAFQGLWDTIKNGEVWQGFVKNKAKNGNFYWVFATVYPYKNEKNEQCYISCRRKPSRAEIEKYDALYKTMR